MLKISKPKEGRGRDRFLDRDEIHRLLEACKESSNPNLLAIVSLAILTGMRYGEIVKLKWSDINFDLSFITLYLDFVQDLNRRGFAASFKSCSNFFDFKPYSKTSYAA